MIYIGASDFATTDVIQQVMSESAETLYMEEILLTVPERAVIRFKIILLRLQSMFLVLHMQSKHLMLRYMTVIMEIFMFIIPYLFPHLQFLPISGMQTEQLLAVRQIQAIFLQRQMQEKRLL